MHGASSTRLALIAGALLACAALPSTTYAFTVPPNDGFVTDTVGVLSDSEEAALEALLREEQQRSSNEIAILIVDSVLPESIADVAVEVGRTWGIGTTENDNGILILLAYSDREVFLATGYGLEGAVPDIVAKGVIEQEMAPLLRDGDYAGGLTAGVEALRKHIAGEYTAERYAEPQDVGGVAMAFFYVVAFAFPALGAFLGRTKSWWLGGVLGAVTGIVLVVVLGWWLAIPILTALGLLFDYLVSRAFPQSGRRGRSTFLGGGRFGGSSGGGGFGGFGGGSFGGGGARGRW